MKKLVSRLSSKVLIFTATVLAVAGTLGAAKAWYPDRQTFTIGNPAPYVTFDSITDNPNYGDERTFFDAKDAANTQTGGFTDLTNVTDGETVMLRMYVHNDAASNLNTVSDGKGGYVGVATGAKARVYLPTATDTALRANAYISASNAKPGEVADTVDFRGATPFQVSYVPGSAVMYTNAVPSGFKLNDSIVSTGAPIGYNGANGTIPGCMQYTGIITLKVKIKAASFKVTKQVAHLNDSSFSKSITANPGETVYYQLGFTNTGSQQLDNVVLRDKLPTNVALVPNSTVLYNANHQSGVNLGTDSITSTNGVNIGSYQGKANGFVQIKAVMPSADKLTCGTNTLVNTVEAWVGTQKQTDTATVTINKTCQQAQTASCDLFHVTQGDNRTVTVDNFKATYTNGASFNDVTVDWNDNTQQLQADAKSVIGKTHKYAQDGKYVITATAHFTVNGKPTALTSEKCSQTVTFTTPTTPPTTPPTTTTPRPTALVNTGAGDVAGLFAGVAIASAVAYRLFLGRRLSRQ